LVLIPPETHVQMIRIAKAGTTGRQLRLPAKESSPWLSVAWRKAFSLFSAFSEERPDRPPFQRVQLVSPERLLKGAIPSKRLVGPKAGLVSPDRHSGQAAGWVSSPRRTIRWKR
jgi:hypothetical protein